MRKDVFAAALFFIGVQQLLAQGDPKMTEVWQPEPRIVTPAKRDWDPPSDATVLFNGKNFNDWQPASGKGDVKWKLEDNAMTVGTGTGAIQTKQTFGDCQLHIEWRSPAIVKGEGQGRGNSGILLMSRYELQVLDSYKNRTYSNGQAGSIYKQHIPLVNVARLPGEWQTYDIIFTAPRFKSDSSLQSPARITVFLNGVLVQNNVTILGTVQYVGMASYKMHGAKEPLLLQDHGDLVSFRNIWVREL
jgi:3-keto-disaccharide hydrolase